MTSRDSLMFFLGVGMGVSVVSSIGWIISLSALVVWLVARRVRMCRTRRANAIPLNVTPYRRQHAR